MDLAPSQPQGVPRFCSQHLRTSTQPSQDALPTLVTNSEDSIWPERTFHPCQASALQHLPATLAGTGGSMYILWRITSLDPIPGMLDPGSH